jgi:hypothetical protein
MKNIFAIKKFFHFDVMSKIFAKFHKNQEKIFRKKRFIFSHLHPEII